MDDLLLSLLTPLAGVVGVLFAWLIALRISHIKNNIAKEFAWQAVLKAEQLWKSGKIKKSERYQNAVNALARKLKLDADTLEDLIEEAVAKMNLTLEGLTPKKVKSSTQG